MTLRMPNSFVKKLVFPIAYGDLHWKSLSVTQYMNEKGIRSSISLLVMDLSWRQSYHYTVQLIPSHDVIRIPMIIPDHQHPPTPDGHTCSMTASPYHQGTNDKASDKCSQNGGSQTAPHHWTWRNLSWICRIPRSVSEGWSHLINSSYTQWLLPPTWICQSLCIRCWNQRFKVSWPMVTTSRLKLMSLIGSMVVVAFTDHTTKTDSQMQSRTTGISPCSTLLPLVLMA